MLWVTLVLTKVRLRGEKMKKTERNLDIYTSKNNGETYKSIGERFNISMGRCRQIYFATKKEINLVEIRSRRAQEAKNKIALEVEEWSNR